MLLGGGMFHCQEDQLVHVLGRGNVPLLVVIYVHKKILNVWYIAGMKILTALHNTGSSLGRNLCF